MSNQEIYNGQTEMNQHWQEIFNSLPYVDGLYYVGDIADVDGCPWLTEEQVIELLRSEY